MKNIRIYQGPDRPGYLEGKYIFQEDSSEITFEPTTIMGVPNVRYTAHIMRAGHAETVYVSGWSSGFTQDGALEKAKKRVKAAIHEVFPYDSILADI